MNIQAIFALSVALTLGGCATCQQHPVYCAIATTIVAGSIVATIEANRDGGHPRAPGRATIAPSPCQANPALCQ